MLIDLQLFDEATQLSKELNIDASSILIKQATQLASLGENVSASKIYIQAGEFIAAIELLGNNGLIEELKVVTQKLHRNNPLALRKTLEYINPSIEKELAIEIYSKLQDSSNLIRMYISNERWDEAFILTEKYPEYMNQVYFPYAQWLIVNNRYEEAHQMFLKAGKSLEAIDVIHTLIENALSENRYRDVSYLHWNLSDYYLSILPNDIELNVLDRNETCALESFYRHIELIKMFIAYSGVYEYCYMPFSSHKPESILRMATFLIQNFEKNTLSEDIPVNVVLYCAIKLSIRLKQFKLLSELIQISADTYFSDKMRNTIDDARLIVSSCDSSLSLTNICYGCSNVNTNALSIHCEQCFEPFILSTDSFFSLPLVSFEIDTERNSENGKLFDRSHFHSSTYTQTHLLESDYKTLENCIEINYGKKCIKIERFKCLDDTVEIAHCLSCKGLFFEDEWNIQALEHGKCSICMKPIQLI